MPSPRFEVPAGAIDDVNTVFTVSLPYIPGSTAVFLNGALQERSLTDGWVETDPANGIVTLKEAPRASGICPDVLQIFYLDNAPSLPDGQVIRLTGRIGLGRGRDLRGAVNLGASAFRGVADLATTLRGSFASSSLRGFVDSDRTLRGVITDCD